MGVAKVRFAPGPLPSEGLIEHPRHVPQPTAEQEREAREIVAGIKDEKLRESVQKAVSLSLARDTGDHPV
jgi:hypothetical protein